MAFKNEKIRFVDVEIKKMEMMQVFIKNSFVLLLFLGCQKRVENSEFAKFKFPLKSNFFINVRDSANVKVGAYRELRLSDNPDDANPLRTFEHKALYGFSNQILICDVIDSGFKRPIEICDFGLSIDQSKTVFENSVMLKNRRKIMTLHDVYPANNDTFYFFENNYPDETLNLSDNRKQSLSCYYIVSMKNGVLGERFGLVDSVNQKIYFSSNGTKGIFDELHFYGNDFIWEKVKFQ